MVHKRKPPHSLHTKQSYTQPVHNAVHNASDDGNISRRQMLGIFGVLGATMGACGIGGLGGLLWLAGRPDDDDPRIVVATPRPTSPGDMTPLATIVPAPMIVGRDAWGALPPDHTARNENGFFSADNPEGWRVYDDELQNIYTTIIVHHSVIDFDDDGATLLDIQRLHRQDRDWADVAYHFFIGKTGNIYEGRDIGARGTHTGGYNTGTLGICFLGNYEEITLNDLQLQSFDRLMQWLVYRLQPTHIAGHIDFNDFTQCPGANIIPYLPQWATQYGLVNSIDGYQPPADTSATQSAFAPKQITCACGDPRCDGDTA